MHRAFHGLSIFVCTLLAQSDAARAPQVSTNTAQIEGQVLAAPASLPLRRARVALRPLEAGLSALVVETGEKGEFALRDIAPGRYSLVSNRDGYLDSSTFTIGALRAPASFYIGSGDRISGVEFRLQPWAVLSGRIRFDDDEPAGNVRVELYREYRSRGRHSFGVAASALTNDRGEYRLFGLQPGAYFIAATYARPLAPGYTEQPLLDANGRELPITGYSTTFYPDTAKLGEALPVHLDYGQELNGIDLSLALVRKVKLHGRVTSGVSGGALDSAGITLTRADGSGSAGIATDARPNFGKDGSFEIRDVAPGSYIVRVDATDSGTTLTGRTLITVGNDEVDNLELLAAPAQTWAARIRTEGGQPLPANRALRVTLEPRSDTGQAVQPDIRATELTMAVMRDEIYDVFVDNLPDDFYLSAVRVGGADVRTSGLPGNLASQTPFDVVLDSRGGSVSGIVAGPDGEVWSGANLMLLPEDPFHNLQSYRSGGADQYGQFRLRGIAPGKYTLIAWLDAPPCDFYDADNLDVCRSTGMPLAVAQADHHNVLFNVKRKP